MIRERLAAAYPGVQRVGLSLWLVEDGQVRRVAVGSVETGLAGPTLERFAPDLLALEAHRPIRTPSGPFRAAAESIVFAHPSWLEHPMRNVLGQLGVLGQNAWRMGYNQFVRRGRYKVGVIDIAPLTPEWVEAFAPPRRPREHRP